MSSDKKTSASKLAGYIILGISIVTWLAIPVVPFLSFSLGAKAGITTVLIIVGEITFYLGIFLIGKEFLVKLKEKFRRKKNKSDEITSTHEDSD
jgi:hypothetical protein